ncbi:hypothetical protein L3X38_003218 [Prunus dulcis]|uniref:CCHC-type domain-containing protein n=1 Tax=Prunus dulcis TaxID=3755 RepID=A0AAD5F1G7_PRUDU|nr:hypothetical protein L3X38_003218 [Prunus dulcis]
MERIFEVLACPVGDRVCLATFLLKGNAYHWWKAVERGYENPTAINWEEFQLVFSEQFYPPSYRHAKKSEFLYLKQGSMSVVEYEHKFNELSRFAPELVAIEDDRCRRCRRDTSGFGGPNQGPSKRRGSYSSSASGGWSGGWGSSSSSGRSDSHPAWTQYSGPQSTASTARAPSRQTGLTCFNCGQVGHMVKDCPSYTQGGGQSQSNSLTCYFCGQVGHTKRNCPIILQSDTVVQGTGAQHGQGSVGENQSQSGASSSVARSSIAGYRHLLGAGVEARATPDVITGMIPIFGYLARVLIDPRATHSIVAHNFVLYVSVRPTPITGSFSISLPTGEVLYAGQVFRNCFVQVDDAWLEANLIPLDLVDLDIILGMDWLEKHHASMDCLRKEVTLRSLGREITLYLEDILVVCDFPDVFPNNLPGLPPERKIEFTIEFLPSTNPIYQTPYRMAPAELRELKTQLQESVDPGFIRPSVSP